MDITRFSKFIEDYFLDIEDRIRDSQSTSEFVESIDEFHTKELDKADKTTIQRLLFCLLKIISTSDKYYALVCCEKLVICMKKLNVMFESFRPIPQLLTQLNFKRLVDDEQNSVVFDLITFILRYYSTVDYKDFGLDHFDIEKIKKEEVKRIWTSIDYVLSKLEVVRDDIKGKNKLTAKALGEIFSYLADFKKDYDGIGPQSNSNSQLPKTGGKLQKELGDIKTQLQLMQDTMGHSQELFKDSINQMHNRDHSPGRNRDKNFGDGIGSELLNMKKKITTVTLNVEALESAISRLKNEGKHKYQHIEDTVQAEIDTLKLFRDRVEIEVQILKKQYNQTGSHSQLNDTRTRRLEDIQEAAKTNSLNLSTQQELQMIKERMINLEKENAKLKEITEKKIQLVTDKVRDIEDNSVVVGQMNSSLKEMLKDAKGNRDEIYSEMSLGQVSEFCNKQKKINSNLSVQLELLEKKQKDQSRQVAVFETNKLSNDNLTKSHLNLMPQGDLILDIKDLQKKTKVIEKDILKISEIQKGIQQEVEALNLTSKERYSEEVFLEKYKNIDASKVNKTLIRDIADVKVLVDGLKDRDSTNGKRIVGLQTDIQSVQLDHRNLQIELQRDYLAEKRLSELEGTVTLSNKELNQRIRDLETEVRRRKIGDGTYEGSGKGDIFSSVVGTAPPVSNLRQTIKKETEHLNNFITEYVNEIASNCVHVIRDEDKKATQKMDALDWMSRNVEFISPKLVQSFFHYSHEIYEQSQLSTQNKNSFFELDHRSSVLKSIQRNILESQDTKTSDGVKGQLPIYLQFLEVALMSQHNLKRAVGLRLHNILVKILLNQNSDENSKVQAQICLSRMVEKETKDGSNLISDLIDTPYFAHWLSTCLDNLPADVTLYASSLKILKKAFQSIDITELVFKNNHNLATNLIRITRKTKEYTNILYLNLEVFKAFTKHTQLIDYITPPEMIEILIDISAEVSVSKIKQIIYESLKNLTTKNHFLKILHNSGLLEIVTNC